MAERSRWGCVYLRKLNLKIEVMKNLSLGKSIRMNKPVSIVLALLLCVSIEGVAQSLLPDFHRYARFAGRATGFVMKTPDGFAVVQQGQDAWWTPKERKACGVTPFYNYMLLADDEGCVALYPDVSALTLAWLGGAKTEPDYIKQAVESGIREGLTVYAASDAGKAFGADSVWLFEKPLPEAVRGRYAYSAEWYAVKDGRPCLFLMCVLTADGLKRKEDYFERLYRSVGYKRKWTYSQEVFDRETMRLHTKKK